MRHVQILTLLLALALLLSGCSPAAGEGEPSAASPPPAESEPVMTGTAPVETAPVESEGPADIPEEPEDLGPWMEDWNLFWKTLEENYPFEGVLYRTTGKTLSGLELQYRYMAQRAESAEDLLRVLRNISGMFDYIGHMNVHNADRYAAFYRNIGAGMDPEEINVHNRISAERLNNERTRILYGYAEETDGTPVSGGVNSRQTEQDGNTNLTFAYFPEQSASYVRVRSMGWGRWGIEAEKQALLDFYHTIENEGYENCIIDIRGNGGGTTTYGNEFLALPNSTAPIGATHYALVKGGEEIPPYYEGWGIELHPIEELPKEELPALEDEDLEGAAYYVDSYVGLSEDLDYPDAPAFSGKFWLLVDEYVYSAAENFTVFCKDTGFATVVGQPTGGDGVQITALICVLPNSGITYQFSTQNGLNLDGSSNEEMGTQPDIVVPKGADALEACLRAIEEGR